MLFLLRGRKLNACRCYRIVINKVKSFEHCPPQLLNPNARFPLLCYELCSSKTTLSATDQNIKRYLNYLMDAYHDQYQKSESVAEILNIRAVSMLLNEKRKITENIKSLNDLVGDSGEMDKLVKEEGLMYKLKLIQIDEKLLDAIIQNLGTENYENVILEIVPGVGGQEAMLFAKDLFEMYVGYVSYLGLNYEVLELDDSDQGGIRKAVIAIQSPKAYEKLRYEGGVHRVQRIPATERSGRLHTSTASVAVLPEPKDLEITLEDKDLRIETKKASGAGGQHVNTTDSAIRVTHIPTGTIVTCQMGRSQIKNKEWALMRLKSILYEQQLDKQVSFTVSLRRKQMGMRSRNEKIRTYNYNQDRVTDHRIPNGTMHHLKEFLKGGQALEELEDKLHKDMQQNILLEIIQKTESELK